MYNEGINRHSAYFVGHLKIEDLKFTISELKCFVVYIATMWMQKKVFKMWLKYCNSTDYSRTHCNLNRDKLLEIPKEKYTSVTYLARLCLETHNSRHRKNEACNRNQH